MYFSTIFTVALASQILPSAIASPITTPLTPNDLARRGEVFVRADEFHLKDDDDHKVWAQLEKTFDAISQIPDDILKKGDDATDKWLVAHGYRPTPKSKRETSLQVRDAELEDRNAWDVIKCVGAISAFIASNAIGAAKLLRIKKYIEALGGIKKSAELLLKASTTAERLKEGGEALALLAGEILGTSMVANNC